jgi:hypothetical protein
METSILNLQGGFLKRIDYLCPFLTYSSNGSRGRRFCELQLHDGKSDLEDVLFLTECDSSNHSICPFYQKHLAECDM